MLACVFAINFDMLNADVWNGGRLEGLQIQIFVGGDVCRLVCLSVWGCRWLDGCWFWVIVLAFRHKHLCGEWDSRLPSAVEVLRSMN